MLRWRVLGPANLTGLAPATVKILPFSIATAYTDVTVLNTVTTILNLGGQSATVRFKNISTAGQAIRLGTAAVAAGSIGTILYPGEEWSVNFIVVGGPSGDINSAICDNGNNGTLNLMVVQTT